MSNRRPCPKCGADARDCRCASDIDAAVEMLEKLLYAPAFQFTPNPEEYDKLMACFAAEVAGWRPAHMQEVAVRAMARFVEGDARGFLCAGFIAAGLRAGGQNHTVAHDACVYAMAWGPAQLDRERRRWNSAKAAARERGAREKREWMEKTKKK